MVLEVLTFPDPRLREISKPVKEFGADLAELAKNLIETMYEENGIGLAAPQVGELVRMLVIDSRPKPTKARYENELQTELEQKIEQPLVIVNPKIISEEGKTTFDEGCLSVPTFFETVERSAKIKLQYQDVHGKRHEIETDGLLAIVVQHEMDHLEGTLFIDHLSLVKSNKIKNQIKKHGYPEKKKDSSEDGNESREL